MATKKNFETETLRKKNDLLSPLKSIVETAFYGNNVHEVKTLAEAYELAHDAPTSIVLDQVVKNTAELGLPEDAKVLVDNGGSIVGRTARARKIYGKDPDEDKKLMKVAMDAVYEAVIIHFYQVVQLLVWMKTSWFKLI